MADPVAPPVDSRQQTGSGEVPGPGAGPAQRPPSATASSVYTRHRDGADSTGLLHKEREERVRLFKQLQMEEVERKKEMLARQDEQSARQREQAERERRRRYDEIRLKELERRTQVEERRRQLDQQESERRAVIMRRNTEREAMMETRRRHTNSQILLGFGSSTPRWDPEPDMGKRSTSTTNVDGAADGRRPLSAAPAGGSSARLRGSALRASTSMQRVFDWTDAPCPAPRSSPGPRLHAWEFSDDFTPAGRAEGPPRDGRRRPASSMINLRPKEPSARRRRSDLTPTMPGGGSFRDAAPPPSARRRTPGKAVSMTRLDQLARPRPTTLRSVHETSPAATGESGAPGSPSKSMSKSMLHLGPRRPAPAPRPTRTEQLRRASREGRQPAPTDDGVSGAATPTSPSRPTSSLSQHSGAPASGPTMRARASPRRQRPVSIAGIPARPASATAATAATAGAAARPADAVRTPTGPPAAGAARRSLSSQARSTPLVLARRTPKEVKAEDAKKKKLRSKSGTPQPSPSVEVAPPVPEESSEQSLAPAAKIISNGAPVVLGAALESRPETASGAVQETVPGVVPEVAPEAIPDAKSAVSPEPESEEPAEVSPPARAEADQEAGTEMAVGDLPQPAPDAVPPQTARGTVAAAVSGEERGAAPGEVTVTPAEQTPAAVENGEASGLTPAETGIAAQTEPAAAGAANATDTIGQPATDRESAAEVVSSVPAAAGAANATDTTGQPATDQESAAEVVSSVPAAAGAANATDTTGQPATDRESAAEVVSSVPAAAKKSPSPQPTKTTPTPTPAKKSASPPPPTSDTAQETPDGAAGRRQAGYTSEAAAKAALAEKRRKAREEAERQAEMERLRREEEERQEQERLRLEEERARQEEQEMMRLMEDASRAEEERLRRAIELAEQERQEEERRRQEEEQQRLQREAEEARARQEAENARRAAAEKLEREEAERKKRRSRVAEIMSRTRGGSTPTKTTSVTDLNEMNAPKQLTAAPADRTVSVMDLNAMNASQQSAPPPADLSASVSDLSALSPAPAPDRTGTERPEPMSTDSSPVHANGTNGRAPAEPAGRADSGVTSGEFGSNLSSLDPLSLKSTSTVSNDDDSLNSNVSQSTTTPSLETLTPPPPAPISDLIQM